MQAGQKRSQIDEVSQIKCEDCHIIQSCGKRRCLGGGFRRGNFGHRKNITVAKRPYKSTIKQMVPLPAKKLASANLEQSTAALDLAVAITG